MIKVKTCLDPEILDMYRDNTLAGRLSKRLSPIFNARVPAPVKKALLAGVSILALSTGTITLAQNVTFPDAKDIVNLVMPKDFNKCSDYCKQRLAEIPTATYKSVVRNMPILPDILPSPDPDPLDNISVNELAVEASQKTGIRAQYLARVAHLESGGNPMAQSPSSTSSAEGLAGFIDQTWLKTLKKHGAEFGYADAAAKIDVQNGEYYISNPLYKNRIMEDLRHDPRCVMMMTAAHTLDNYHYLKSELGQNFKVTETDLYKAHFMGAAGAVNFHRALKADSSQTTAEIMPQATRERGNNALLGSISRPKTIQEVHDTLSGKVPPTPVSIKAPGL